MNAEGFSGSIHIGWPVLIPLLVLIVLLGIRGRKWNLRL